jgi:hypothetical protein
MPFLPMYIQNLGVTERAEVVIWSGVISGSAALTMTVVAPVWGVLPYRLVIANQARPSPMIPVLGAAAWPPPTSRR